MSLKNSQVINAQELLVYRTQLQLANRDTEISTNLSRFLVHKREDNDQE